MSPRLSSVSRGKEDRRSTVQNSSKASLADNQDSCLSVQKCCYPPNCLGCKVSACLRCLREDLLLSPYLSVCCLFLSQSVFQSVHQVHMLRLPKSSTILPSASPQAACLPARSSCLHQPRSECLLLPSSPQTIKKNRRGGGEETTSK